MAKQNQRKEVRQEARQAAQAGTFNQSNVQAMRQAGVQPQAIQNIREVARQAPAAAPQGVNIGYGVTNTGSPGGLSMPGGTNAAGQPIPASQASNVFKLNIPFSTAGVTNIMGNPMNNFDTGFQVVGDGVNWQDPKNAGLLGQYTSPEAINNHINTMWAMSSANPNRDANMAAFMDSGSAESLITGRPPTAMPTGFTGLYNPSMTGLNTPWSQQYAAANSGAGGSGNAGGAGTGGSAMSGGGGAGAGGRGSAGNASNLGQAIRAAGAGGISKGELNQMLEGSGKSGGGAVIQRLDQINRSLKEKDRTGISLNSGAANMLINQASKKPTSMFQESEFGTGRIGSALQGMMGTRESGGYINPQSGQQFTTPGKKPKLMLGGTAIRPGGRETVRGFGKQFTPRTAAPIDTTPVSASTTDTGGGGMDMGGTGMGESFTAPETPTAAATTPGTFGMGADLANWATGFKAKRSSRKGAGPRAQGLGSQRVAPSLNTLGL